MAVASNFPALKPTADFNFAATKTLDPRISFSRGSAAWYYDGSVSLAEENLWVTSTDISPQTEVTKTLNAAITPDGYAAVRLTPTVNNAQHIGGYRSAYCQVGIPITFSFIGKADGYNQIRIGDVANGVFYCTVDVATQVVSGTGGSAFVGASVSAEADGWYRVVVRVSRTTAGSIAFGFTPMPTGTASVQSTGSATFAGDGVSGFLAGEFQIERRDGFSLHAPTGAGPVSKNMRRLVQAANDEPRFQHDALTGECRGFLPERQVTNTMLQSEFFTGIAGGNASGGTIGLRKMFGPRANVCNSLYFAPGPALNTYFYKGLVTAAAPWTLTVFVKMDDGGAPVLGAAPTAAFDLIIGGLSASSQKISNLGNGLYAVSGTVTTGASNLTSNGILQRPGQTRGFRTTAWCLYQFDRELTYIPTTEAVVTRLADTPLIDGPRLDTFYSQEGGTFVCEFDASVGAASAAGVVFGMSFGVSSADRMNVYNASGVEIRIDNFQNSAASGASSVTGLALYDGQRTRLARRVGTYNWAASVNGGAVSASGNGLIGNKNRLGIGSPAYSSVDRADRPIARLAYYRDQLTNAQLQALSRS